MVAGQAGCCRLLVSVSGLLLLLLSRCCTALLSSWLQRHPSHACTSTSSISTVKASTVAMAAAPGDQGTAAAANAYPATDVVHRSVFTEGDASSDPVAIIVLNIRQLEADTELLLRQAWKGAAVRLCADGGANRLYDALGDGRREEFLPDVIKGDLDSLRPEVAAYYRERGARIVRAVDQSTNDFQKCLEELLSLSSDGDDRERCSAAGTAVAPRLCAARMTVVALGAFGGRFDQEMAGLHLLHMYTPRFRRFVLLGGGNISFLLLPGRRHRIIPDPALEAPRCALVPLVGPCGAVTTRGLVPDLLSAQLAMGLPGAPASTSSCSSTTSCSWGGYEVAAGEVVVETDAPLVWAASLAIGAAARALRA